MIDFSTYLDLPFIWGGIIALAVFVYIFLDGFDLGCGILFPFAGSDERRSRIMNSVAPFWDGNETWLVLGGGGLFAAFPVAYGVVMSAMYLPVTFMLFGLIFRGVAFEFRFKSEGKQRVIWDRSFAIGSTVASFFQGVILGALLEGVVVDNRVYAGGPWDWFTPFSVLCGFTLVVGYALLGAAWLVMKTDNATAQWARLKVRDLIFVVFIFMGLVSVGLILKDARIREHWLQGFWYLSVLPVIALVCYIQLWKEVTQKLNRKHRYRPFLLTMLIFLMAFLGVCSNIYPWIVPYAMTLHEAAATGTSLSFMLIGAVIMLPIIGAYTAFSYYVFRGDQGHESLY